MTQRDLFSRYDDAPSNERRAEGSSALPPIPGVSEVRFSGPAYDETADDARLRGQILRVFDVMKDGRWRTLSEIERLTGDPQASISAQLRHLRKPRFGAHELEKRSRGERTAGLWEYRLLVGPRG